MVYLKNKCIIWKIKNNVHLIIDNILGSLKTCHEDSVSTVLYL